MNKKAIVLLSGGLDSILATKLMLEQGVDVLAVNFSAKLCMCGCKKTGESAAQVAARILNVTLKTIDITDDFIEIVKNPSHGYGANMNPCIDCKIYMFKHAKDLMAEAGASFLVTGEVLGERPMSQRMDALQLIEKAAGVKGILLRPLTAKNLDLTLPEKEGIVDRERLLDIRGRSRKPQMALAEKFGITKYPSPAGGCLRTDPGFAKRVEDAMKHGEFNSENLAILSVGRQFRISEKTRLVVGRDEKENDILMSLAKQGDVLFELTEHEGPTSLLRGKIDDGMIELAAKITAYHTKLRAEESVKIDHWKHGSRTRDSISVKPIDPKDMECFRI
ncbi:MAG: hypothetical protein Q7S30_04570 [Candidatus Omnitrophota bacterium]|nr:hypothetical protein [Candidatus Omnitrophota bacterium]